MAYTVIQFQNISSFLHSFYSHDPHFCYVKKPSIPSHKFPQISSHSSRFGFDGGLFDVKEKWSVPLEFAKFRLIQHRYYSSTTKTSKMILFFFFFLSKYILNIAFSYSLTLCIRLDLSYIIKDQCRSKDAKTKETHIIRQVQSGLWGTSRLRLPHLGRHLTFLFKYPPLITTKTHLRRASAKTPREEKKSQRR